MTREAYTAAQCKRCKSPVDPDSPSTLRRVEGWERKATAVSRRSASDIVLREAVEPAEYLCGGCSHALKAGVAPLQGELVPRAA